MDSLHIFTFLYVLEFPAIPCVNIHGYNIKVYEMFNYYRMPNFHFLTAGRMVSVGLEQITQAGN